MPWHCQWHELYLQLFWQPRTLCCMHHPQRQWLPVTVLEERRSDPTVTPMTDTVSSCPASVSRTRRRTVIFKHRWQSSGICCFPHRFQFSVSEKGRVENSNHDQSELHLIICASLQYQNRCVQGFEEQRKHTPLSDISMLLVCALWNWASTKLNESHEQRGRVPETGSVGHLLGCQTRGT